MSPNIEMWILNIRLLIGILFVLIVLFVVGVFSYACIRSLIRQYRVRRARQQDYREKHRSDGTAYPPTCRGLCDNCQSYGEKLYFLPSGQRLCEECYEKFEEKSPDCNNFRKPLKRS